MKPAAAPGSSAIFGMALFLLLVATSPSFCGAFQDDFVEVNSLIYSGKFAEGLALAEDTLQRATAVGDSSSMAFSQVLISDSHYYLGHRESTLQPLQQALEIYEALNDYEGIGRSHYNIAYYYERSDPSLMVEILNTASSFAEKAQDDQLEMNIANATGVALWGLGRYEPAIGQLEKSMTLARKNNWDSARAAASQNIALIHLNQGRPREAIACLNETLKIFKGEGATHSYAVGLGNKGNALRDLREYEEGLACYEEALSIHRENNYIRGQAINLNNIADVYLTLYEWDQARVRLIQALDINEKLENERDTSLSLSSLGNLALYQGKHAEAREYFLRSLEIAEALGDPYLLDGPEISLATIAMHEGYRELTSQWLDRAENHARLAGKSPSLGSILAMRSKLAAKDENWALAVTHIQEAIALHEEIRLRTHTFHWYAMLAGFFAALGDQESAGRSFATSLELVGHLDGTIASDRFRVGFFQEVSLIYHQHSLWLANQGEVMKGMAMLDQGRSRVLALRLLQNQRQNELTHEQSNALNQISRLQTKLREETTSPEDYQKILILLETAEWDYEKASGAPNVSSNPATDVDMELLDRNTLHLSYSAKNDSLLVFGLSHGGATFRVIPQADVLLTRARMYTDLMTTPNSGPRSRVAGKSLFRILMGPELQAFQGDNILINPDLDLWTFPFVSLVTQYDRYLGEDFSLGMTPSWSVLQTLSRLPESTGRGALVLANSKFKAGVRGGSPLQDLASAASEAENVASLFRSSTMLLNAGESEFKVLPLAKFELLHFATHALTKIDHPLRSCIVLGLDEGQDGLLQAREIHHLPLDCNLVVVSGCKSGSGKVVLGEGLMGVTHSFLRAGSRCVVMSRWDVNDEGAAHFMDEFYRALQNHTVAEAVSLAQQKMRESEKWAHPFYWAPFYVAGEGNIRLESLGGTGSSGESKSRKAVGAMAMLGILAGLVMILRKWGHNR